jgi:GNAT superfamily N-acetyltransferase
MSSQYTFKVADKADVAAIVALVQSAYRGDSGRKGWTTEADLLDGQRTDVQDVVETIERVDSCVLLALLGDELHGCCHVARDGTAGYFGRFAVSPYLQGAGLGTALLMRAEAQARQWGCLSMKMTVIDGRAELIAYYERRGYRRTGEFAPFPYGDERFGIPLRDDLRFAWLAKSLEVLP